MKIIAHVWLAVLLCLSALSHADGFVWRVSDGDKQLFLAGTIHLLSKSDYPLPSSYEKAYLLSQRVYFETDLAQARSAKFQQYLLDKMYYPAGENLLQKLDSETLSALNTYMQVNQLSAVQFGQLRVAMVAMTISMAAMAQLGMTEQGVDQWFFDKAVADNKARFGLESIEQQIDFLVAMGDGEESALIRQTLDEIEQMPVLLPSLKSAWRVGDAQRMSEELIMPMQQQYPKIYQQLLVQRNNNWLPIVDAALHDDSVAMILVGSAHLLGKDGLLQQLKSRGYKVQSF
jgi:hypothetical protein